MGQTTNEIEAHLAEARDDLGSNLHELERKVRTATDWKKQFKRNPTTMLGVAFGGGFFLALMTGGRKVRRTGLQSQSASNRQTGPAIADKTLETWHLVKDALVGVAATRFADFVSEIVPGFQSHFERTGGTGRATAEKRRSLS